ncbi:MAG: hypothetical protein J6S00_06515 [Clostridia bacterium]|nr:hypothetical protein [Clostridia bacterium]
MLYIILAIVVLFILVLLIRTLTFKPINEFKPLETDEVFDSDKATENLQKLVQ